ncbi:hypothetical protein NF701_02415 [Sphingomonadaceae bacterium OTU29THOMA1]|nr:hypothetical protein NF701_02415 [Sphingomonadaceae bacterium OTU29THOMA1]
MSASSAGRNGFDRIEEILYGGGHGGSGEVVGARDAPVDRCGDVAGGALVGTRLDDAVGALALDALLDLGSTGLLAGVTDPRHGADDRQHKDASDDQASPGHAAVA